MTSPSIELGYTRMLEAINSKEDLAQFLNKLLANRAESSGLIEGALSCLVGCYFSARNHGFQVPVEDETLRSFLEGSLSNACFELTIAMNRQSPDVASRQITGLVVAINHLRKQISWPKRQQADAVQAQRSSDPIKVEVVSMPKAGVSKVEVVSLPSRQTTTEVKRDPKTHNIVSSVQTEVDL